MGKREKWLKIEMVLTLGFYKFEDNFESKKKVAIFAAKVNALTGKTRSSDSFGFRIANYRSVDPSYHKIGLTNGGKEVNKIWDEYVTTDPSLSKLAIIYSNFSNGMPINSLTNAVVANPSLKTKVVSVVIYNRSEKVKNSTLQRANGVCELCGQTAPFKSKDGSPYLEVHHYKQLSEGGNDTTKNTLALCPNCHRRFHYGPKLSSSEISLVLKRMK